MSVTTIRYWCPQFPYKGPVKQSLNTALSGTSRVFMVHSLYPERKVENAPFLAFYRLRKTHTTATFFKLPGKKKKKCQNGIIKTVVFKVVQWIYLFHSASASDDCIWRFCQTIRNLHLKPLINVKTQAKYHCPALWIGQHPDKEQLRTNLSLTELNYHSSNCT